MNKPVQNVHSAALNALLDVIKTEQLRTGLNPTQLLKVTSDVPADLICVYKRIKDKEISLSHAAFIVETYKALPTQYLKREEYLIVALQSEIKRTGIKLKALFETYPKECEHLSQKSIRNWIYNKKMKRIKKREYDGLLAAYKTIPDETVNLTPAMRKYLDAEIERTRARSAKFILRDPDRPKDLSFVTLQDLIDGHLDELSKLHWDYILKRYKRLPNARGFSGKVLKKEEG